jgi:murein DD-endopeptidase MepM/ murein hydrolase activator NlpD
MNPATDPYGSENNSRTLIIMVLVLLAIIGVVVGVVLVFKPKTQPFDTTTGNVKSTPREHIESIDPYIQSVFNLSDEIRLFDELFDVLVYSENPDVNRIGDFVSGYQKFASTYPVNTRAISSNNVSFASYDSSIISFDRQNKYLTYSIETLLESINKKKKVFMTIPVTYPVDKELARIVSGFGMRDHPILEKRIMHNGIDIAAPTGTEVKATASGKVIRTEEKPGYGRSCLVEHKFGYQTLYGHMVRLVVGENKWVQKGEVLGYVGNTGLSVAPHLHYEVRKNGQPLNPSYFIFENLNKEEYKEVILLGSKKNEILSF